MKKKSKSNKASKASIHKKRRLESKVVKLDYVELVDMVRKSRSNEKSNIAFNEIERRMMPKIKQISYKFNIPGCSRYDICQESLFALRFKAIKDYDPTRGNGTGPYPFDKFAVLCIRRHLSTKLKASYQNKKRVLNSCLSLDQDRNTSSDDNLYLADIIPRTDGNVLENLEQNEYYKTLFSKLFEKLSKFEREVFMLYIHKFSYDQISARINKKHGNKKSKINVKSVDNALSRIKNKAKEIFDKYGKEE